VYFGRMLDKIRLHAAGKLPREYCDNLGEPRAPLFDARCCRFLGVPYADLVARTLAGGSDEEILAWAETRGAQRTDDECNVWNRFMIKIGWRDDRSEFLRQRIGEFGLAGKPIETFFDLLEYDEGRDPLRTRPWEFRPANVVVLMGVAGSGKTTVGLQLAADLGWRFNDADDFHPPANIAKMSAGIPLDDTDRAPWLAAIREHITTCLRNGESAVVTCSALKERYRDVILTDPARIKLVYLKGSRDLLLERIAGRAGHFMKPQMLESQLNALEEPRDALIADIAQAPEQIVAHIKQAFSL
jgi:carbohydrate kinase (thermoresistant glucokinase family)